MASPPQPPSITSVTPDTSDAGSRIKVVGAWFGNQVSQNRVWFLGPWNGHRESITATIMSLVHGQLDTLVVTAPSGFVNGESCEVHIQSQATDGVWRQDYNTGNQAKYWTYRIGAFAEPMRTAPPNAPTVAASPMPSEPMDTVRLYSYGEPVAYAHTLIELNAGFETPTNATFETVLWGNPAYTISRTDYEYGASGLIATYQNGNVTAPTRYETNVGYFDFATNKRYYYLKDQLGNVRCVVDEQGNVTSWTDYHAFGAIREQNSGTSYDPYKMLNHELDIETSWYQHGARTYDPWLGQFLNVDPLRDKFLNLSPYHYGRNNPIRFKDPSGNEPEGDGLLDLLSSTAKTLTERYTQADGAKLTATQSLPTAKDVVNAAANDLSKLPELGLTLGVQIGKDLGGGTNAKASVTGSLTTKLNVGIKAEESITLASEKLGSQKLSSGSISYGTSGVAVAGGTGVVSGTTSNGGGIVIQSGSFNIPGTQIGIGGSVTESLNSGAMKIDIGISAPIIPQIPILQGIIGFSITTSGK